ARPREADTPRDPGGKEALTYGGTDSPRSTAFFARGAAPIMSAGFDVLVQEVIDAIRTSPCPGATVAGGRTSWGTSSTRVGLGRLLTISISVSGFVSFFPAMNGSCSCLPPPTSGFSGVR